jgi:cytoskeletal protein CcmA (bactofilin family)
MKKKTTQGPERQLAVNESEINVVAEGTRIEGKISFDHISRVHGTLVGQVSAKEGSTLILSESSMVEGDISADILFVDGYVHGDISASTQVVISRTGRVVGNIKTKSLKLEFGGYFEGSALATSGL